MITYKYKLYKTDKTKYLDKMLAEACFVWNHALALQKRYYRLYGGYIPLYTMQKHQSKRGKRCLLSAMAVQEIIERLDKSYKRFFNRIAKRPPKFKKTKDFSSIVFKGVCNQGQWSVNVCNLKDNSILFVLLGKSFKYHKSRQYEGIIKRVILYRDHTGEYYIFVVTDAETKKYGKTHNGASVGIDFGLKTYLTLSDGTRYENPQFMKSTFIELHCKQRTMDKCKNGSNNRERKRKELGRIWNDICNKRSDFQWNLAHQLCRKYDHIFVEDLDLKEMRNMKRFGRKLKDLDHSGFILKLEYIATKYDVVVHKINRYYPSSMTCTCGYVNKELRLSDRKWVCPHCGAVHDRDLLAANNILRRGIYELESNSKTLKHSADGQLRYYPTITRIIA